MKKIIYIYILFLASVLFYYTYDSFNYIHYSNIFNLENGLSESKHPYALNLYDTEKESEILNAVSRFAKEQDIQFLVHELMPTDDGTYLYHYYVQTTQDDWIYHTIRMTGGEKIDLTDASGTGYLSSDKNDENAAGTFSSYDNRHFEQEKEVIRILHFANRKETAPSSVSFYFDSEQSAVKMQEYITEHFKDSCHLERVNGQGGSEEAIHSTYRNSEISFAIVCSFIILLLLILCRIVKDKKEILIMKMNGHSTPFIVVKLYLSFLMSACVLFSFSLFSIALFVIRSFDPYFNELYKELFHYVLYAFLAVPLILAFSFLYIKHTTSVLELKNDQSFYLMNYANVFLKIVISIFMLTPFITSFNKLISRLQKYHYLKTNETVLNDFYTFSYYSGDRADLQPLYDQTIYFDMSDYAYRNDFTFYMMSGLSLYDTLKEEEALPLLYVNKTYLRKKNISFLDEFHQPVDMERLEDKTYLIPLSKKNLYHPEDGEIIYVETTGTHQNWNASEPLYQIREPILVLYGKYAGMNIYPNAILFDGMDRSEAEHLIRSVSSDDFRIHSTRANFNREMVNCEDDILSCGFITLTFGLLYGLFMLQFCYLFIDNNKKEIAVNYLCGKTKWEIYGFMWLINLAIYLTVILVSMLLLQYSLSSCVRFSSLFLLLDTIIILIFIHKTEKNDLIPTLRGGS